MSKNGVLNALVRYAQEHFKTEETLMAQGGYPDLEAHKREHAEFEERLAGFLAGASLGHLDKTGLQQAVLKGCGSPIHGRR